MKRVVITGGPCGGKSSVKAALKDTFHRNAVFVPEIATMLLDGGYPMPGRDLEWSPAWQSRFQRAVWQMQTAFEASYDKMAEEQGKQLVICDRGLLDGAAYFEDGMKGLAVVIPDYKDIVIRQIPMVINEQYDVIIHLVSVAKGDPERYGNHDNPSRFEPLERAQELEERTRMVWEGHPNHHIFDCSQGIEGKIKGTIELVRSLLD